METIRFSSVVPQVFSSIANQLESDIWNTEAVFQKGHLYLVEADSGKGKSTFCSYVVGYRRDYSGHVMFDETDTMSFTVKDWVNVRQRHISHLFQELRLFPELTALENVEIKNAITGFKSREEITEWFDMLGIGYHGQDYDDRSQGPGCRSHRYKHWQTHEFKLRKDV